METWFLKIDPRESNYFGVKRFLSEILISKMGVKIDLSITMKKYEADPEKGFPQNRF